MMTSECTKSYCVCKQLEAAKAPPIQVLLRAYGLPLIGLVVGALLGALYSEGLSVVGAGLGLVFVAVIPEPRRMPRYPGS